MADPIIDLVNEIMSARAGDWEPFVKSSIRNGDPVLLAVAHKVDPRLSECDIFVNNFYQVSVFRNDNAGEGWPSMIHLSIKRHDKAAIHDWRDLQRIKNELVGPEHEAVELYPAESRLVDSCNQYHLFVMATPEARFPFGFEERYVSNESTHGTVQRPFPRDATPSDCKSLEEYMLEKGLKP